MIMSKYASSKVNLYIDVAEKVAWWARLQEFDLDERKLAYGLRECIRIAYDYEYDAEEQAIASRLGNVKPPEVEQFVFDYDNYKGSTIVCLVLPVYELVHWRKLRNELGFTSLEKLAKDGIRKVLSITPYGVVDGIVVDAEVKTKKKLTFDDIGG